MDLSASSTTITFGDLKSFRARFARLGNQADFAELKERLKPICKRTLRRQVLEYVPYTDRHALVQEFVPSPDEQKLYDLVSELSAETDPVRSARQPAPIHDTHPAEACSRHPLMPFPVRWMASLRNSKPQPPLPKPSLHRPMNLPDNLEDYDELADEWEEDGEAASRSARPVA